ncbi:MAG: DUF4340 domain-containing protein [Patescibacteria group bacterium]
MEQNRKRLLVLLVLLLFMAIAFITSSFLPSLVHKMRQSLFSLTQENLRGYIITGDIKNQSLVHDKNVWVVKKDNVIFPADPEKINRITDILNNLTKETVVSENIKKHALFGIDKKKITIQTTAGEKKLYIGKYYAGNAHYARIGNENQIFLGEGLGELNLDEDYRDLNTDFIANKEDINSILIESSHNTTTLAKKGKEWSIGAQRASITKVDQFLNDLITLEASDILPEKDKLQTTDESFSITTKGKDSATHILFVPYNETSYKVQSSSSTLTYVVADVYVSALQKNIDDFLE